MIFWHDGQWLDGVDVKTGILTHALHYGTSVFEGIRVYNGRAFRLSEHNKRLCESARILDMDLELSEVMLDELSTQLIEKNQLVNAYIRSIAFAGPGRIIVGTRNTKPSVALTCWEWPSYYDDKLELNGAYQNAYPGLPVAIKLTISKWCRPAAHTAPVHCKGAGNYVLSSLARNEAESKNFDDSLLLTHDGKLAEATGANVFLVINGELHTPLADCFLSGITRRVIINLANALGINTYERYINPEELSVADEVFLTGTAVEVQPICQVDLIPFSNHEITAKLYAAYMQLVRSGTDI
jgi:branched-chain amino acid aminotransferase